MSETSDTTEYRQLFESQLGADLKTLERIGAGRNSRVYRLVRADGRLCLAKVYHRHKEDRRDRLGAEFGGLTFLWQNGIRAIPEPLACDPEHGFALYEYIHGDTIEPHQIRVVDIDRAVEFLVALEDLKMRPKASDLPSASEACFTVADIIAGVQQRVARLSEVPENDILATDLHRFLNEEFTPFFERIKLWSRSRLERAGLSVNRELPLHERTLSPSDFGFHNALRRPDGSLTFLDFEYFGWDDPAKMIVDFLFHPGMALSMDHRKRFLDAILKHFRALGPLPARVSAVYPLFGLKWCLILLNEFVPVDLARRDFAGGTQTDLEHRRADQLAKAVNMMTEVKQRYESDSLFD